MDIDQVGTSCGYSVPFYEFNGFRTTLHDFFEKRVASEKAGNRADGIERYWAFKNAWSMDGLPGLQRGVRTAIADSVKPIKKMVGPFAPMNGPRRPQKVFTLADIILVALLSCVSTTILILLLWKFWLAGMGSNDV